MSEKEMVERLALKTIWVGKASKQRAIGDARVQVVRKGETFSVPADEVKLYGKVSEAVKPKASEEEVKEIITNSEPAKPTAPNPQKPQGNGGNGGNRS